MSRDTILTLKPIVARTCQCCMCHAYIPDNGMPRNSQSARSYMAT